MARSAREKSESGFYQIIQEKLKIENGTVLQTFSKSARDNSLRILKDAGLSDRQIERLTGISRGIVLKAQKLPRNPSP